MLLVAQAKINFKQNNMKKLSTLIATFLFIGFCTFSSCKKCSTCEAKNKADGTIVHTSPEFCGDTQELNDFETNYKAEWATNNYGVSCVQN